MKKRLVLLITAAVFCIAAAGCGGKAESKQETTESAVSQVEDTSEQVSEEPEQTEEKETEEKEAAQEEASAESSSVLEDGVYTAEFNTDSSMFHVNEAYEGTGTLTVENGKMTIHVSLVSKNIINLYSGLAEDAEEAEDDALIQPTEDEVTYSDGMTETVYGFDIPVPVIGEEFDVALIGKKGVWYDHKVSVENPVPAE
ncbi:MAG: hypothetical protein MJ117_10120 [Lachnospiraceae bacterium]|nr:hypothetical protein [Lachnospiraceae bacterium]